MSLGMLQYQKAGTGLRLLREQILGPERFDYAFRTYIRRWSFKSPRPADFFRTMEDASGMDLDWFWRGWFVEAAKLDQAVASVRQPRGERPARITFTNLGRMVMPLQYEITFTDGSTTPRSSGATVTTPPPSGGRTAASSALANSMPRPARRPTSRSAVPAPSAPTTMR